MHPYVDPGHSRTHWQPSSCLLLPPGTGGIFLIALAPADRITHSLDLLFERDSSALRVRYVAPREVELNRLTVLVQPAA
jgi:hypothetical protein